jgi:hypothetical protein
VREIVILRGDERRCRDHARRVFPKWPLFDNADKALAFLRRERLSQALVYAADIGREQQLVGLGYFLRTELVP